MLFSNGVFRISPTVQRLKEFFSGSKGMAFFFLRTLYQSWYCPSFDKRGKRKNGKTKTKQKKEKEKEDDLPEPWGRRTKKYR